MGELKAGSSEIGSDPSSPKIKATSGIDNQIPDNCCHGDEPSKFKT